MEHAAPGHVALVRELLIDVLTRDQLTVLADGLVEPADACSPRTRRTYRHADSRRPWARRGLDESAPHRPPGPSAPQA